MFSKIVLVVFFFFVNSSFAHPKSPLNPSFQGWDTFFGSNLTSLIHLFHSDGKSYYFGFHFKATYFQAAQFCEDIHMKLVTIENAEENNRLYKYVRDSNKGDLFWTSGSKLLDGKHWIWMSKGQPIEYTNWAPGNPDSQTEHCIAAFHSKNVGLTWTDRDCLVQLGFICERRVPANDTPEANTEVTHWKSIYENPFMSANVPLFHLNNKSYFLGRYFKGTFQEALQICKMMHMDLVSVTSKEENDRIYKYIRDTNGGDIFWTSGSRMIDGTTWVWMSLAQVIDYTNWYTGQPDSPVDHCLNLSFQKDKGLFWTDAACVLRYAYICEKPRERILFERNGIVTSQQAFENLKHAYSALIQMESRSYYLGTHFKITQLEASQFCQRNHMQLVSITTEEEDEEIRQLLLHHSAEANSYWISARKLNEKDKWTWSTGTSLTYSNLKFKNSDSNKDLFCIEIFSNGTWSEQSCDEERYFICEKTAGVKTCPKVPPILNIYVNNESAAKNVSLPYAYFKIANATFDTIPEIPDPF
ncbi:macrophage mannose receptor 1 [Anoplophora glabripennis]|uniref:macrophage mannose receptor 1 n=1 Tax=Anoplophora glabripennis TaxID=217634 RepID=UPI000875095C|nr:macrophage mannose receptor 1 [Anoplophora glabripennis]